MKLEQEFTIDAPLESVWAALIDLERVAPCLPGAAIEGHDEDGTYRGSFTIKLGPTTAAYRGEIRIVEIDESTHTATLTARGTDKRGQGGASATIVNRLTASEGATVVNADTDFTITGRLARFGRGGMIQDISNRLLRDFATCLQQQLGEEPGTTGAKTPADMPSSEETPADKAAREALELAMMGGEPEPRPPAQPVETAAGEATAPAERPYAEATAPADMPEAGATAAAETPGAETAAPAETPGTETAAPAETPGTETAAPAETPGTETAAPAETPGTGTTTPAETPYAEAKAPAEMPPSAPPPSVPPPAASRPVQPAAPVKAGSLFLSVLWERIRRVFKRGGR
jgi:carbon monoxide dehydrogenase subunit G